MMVQGADIALNIWCGRLRHLGLDLNWAGIELQVSWVDVKERKRNGQSPLFKGNITGDIPLIPVIYKVMNHKSPIIIVQKP